MVLFERSFIVPIILCGGMKKAERRGACLCYGCRILLPYFAASASWLLPSGKGEGRHDTRFSGSIASRVRPFQGNSAALIGG